MVWSKVFQRLWHGRKPQGPNGLPHLPRLPRNSENRKNDPVPIPQGRNRRRGTKKGFHLRGRHRPLCLFCLEKNPPSGIYNCGTGTARTFVDLSKALFKAVGKERRIEWVDTPEKFRAGYQYFTQAEMGKIRTAGYNSPFLSIEEGVRQYVEWLKKQ